MNFTAIDFETADWGPDSACAVGLVRVSRGKIVSREHHLIRPPRRRFAFTYIHGIRWEDVREAPAFEDVWPKMRGIIAGSEFIAAHNVRFDRRVLEACCRASGILPPEVAYVCTVALARAAWKLRPANLPNVCRHLGLPLDHHNALSDAQACARIVLKAIRAGHPIKLLASETPRGVRVRNGL